MNIFRNWVPVYLILLGASQSLLAQTSETLRTPRPGRTLGPFTTGKNIFQIQSGFTYAESQDHELDRKSNTTSQLVSLRHGILESFELRSAFLIRQDRIRYGDGTERSMGGLGFWVIGVRYNIISGSGFKPSFGLQTDVGLTWVDKDYRTQEISPRIMLIHAQKVSDKVALLTNWSVSWNGNNIQPNGNYSVKILYRMVPKWSVILENYGTLAGQTFTNRWDAGLGFLVNNDLQLDLSAGLGNNGDVNDWFMDTGLSWRIDFSKD